MCRGFFKPAKIKSKSCKEGKFSYSCWTTRAEFTVCIRVPVDPKAAVVSRRGTC